MAIAAVRQLLEEGLCEIGDVTDRGFFGWDLAADVALERVRTQWEALDRQLGPGDICWLCNTSAGDRRAEEVLEQRPDQNH